MYSAEQLNVLCEKLADRLDEILDKLNIPLRRSGKYYQGQCFIHGGDNPTALAVSPNGMWRCYTGDCHRRYVGSILGLIRASLSKNDQIAPFGEVISWAESFLGISEKDLPAVKPKVSQPDWSIFIEKEIEYNFKLTREDFRKRLVFPAEYFVKRGWSEEILDKYDVGLCVNQKKPLYGRSVVPVYDDRHKYVIACTARSPHERCPQCNCYHGGPCPENKQWYSKWRHSKNFCKRSMLYNLWFAYPHIADTGQVLLVESPGNVWKLAMAGVFNAVALLGKDFSAEQQELLEQLPIYTVTILTDNDPAGEKCKTDIVNKLKNLYRIKTPMFASKDVGELTVHQIKEVLSGQSNN